MEDITASRDVDENVLEKAMIAAVCVIILSVSGCTMHREYYDNLTMLEMVKNGADPQDARCAVKDRDDGVCAIRAATKNK